MNMNTAYAMACNDDLEDAVDLDQAPVATGIGSVDWLQTVCNRANAEIDLVLGEASPRVCVCLAADPSTCDDAGRLPRDQWILELRVAGRPVYRFDSRLANDAVVVAMDAAMLASAVVAAYAVGITDGREAGIREIRNPLRAALGL